MSCLSVKIQRVGAAAGEPVGCNVLSAKISRVASDVMSFRFGLVCPTNLDNRTGILWASDGRLITLEGGYLIPNGR